METVIGGVPCTLPSTVAQSVSGGASEIAAIA